MRRLLASVLVVGPALSLGATVALAAPPVIGGSNAPAGKWPDVAAIMYGGMQECTGTLVAPTVVLTAGHCNDPAAPPPPDAVLLGTNSLSHPELGETISIIKRVTYPDALNNEDVTVLVLASPAKEAPRPIATGWASLEIKNAAAVTFVGYGATDKNGSVYGPDLKEATSTITDFDCSKSSGCNVAARPAGELGAGGMGIDTCPGDSGGPMYLPTSFGTFLAGITSRGYDNAQFACSEGGIYERPDKFVAWIEQQAGVPVSRGPEPTADPLTAAAGGGAETTITPNDPKSDGHAYAITAPPADGTAAVRDDGRVRVCVAAGASGADTVTVTITDSKDPTRALAMTIPIAVSGTDSGTCTLAFSDGGGGGGCGCASGGLTPGAALPFAAALAMVLRRRRGVAGSR